MFFKGLFVILLPWLIVFSARIFGPVTFGSLSGSVLIFVATCLIVSAMFYAAGYAVVKNKVSRWPEIRPYKPSGGVVFHRVYSAFFFFTLLFALISFYDFLVVKAGVLSEIVAMRESEHLSGPRNSLIGAIGTLLSGAPVLFFALVLSRKNISRVKKYATYGAIFLGFASMFLTGGRNAFFIGLVFVFAYYLFFIKVPVLEGISDAKPHLFGKFILLLVITLGVYYSLNIFFERFEHQGLNSQKALDHLSHDYNVSIAEISCLYTNSLCEKLYPIFVYLIYYGTHALNYIDAYFLIDESPMFLGAYNFSVISRMADITLSINSFEHVRSQLLVVGVYLSLPGSLFLDFGYIGTIVVMAFMSFWFGYFIKNVKSLALYQKMFASYFTVLFIFSPVYSALGMANGFSLIFLMFVTLLLSVRLR